MFSVITSHPVAVQSVDHLHPYGTKQDNHSDGEFIRELESHFGRKFSLMDLGCAGGQLVIDALQQGHSSVGIEGSDYSVRRAQFNWPAFHQTHLFTADVGQPFVVLREGQLVRFDVITAWEVLEHIEPALLNQLMLNIETHLAPNGMFLGTVNCKECFWEGQRYHQSVMSKRRWFKLFEKRFKAQKYPFRNYLRHDCVDIGDSFLVCVLATA